MKSPWLRTCTSQREAHLHWLHTLQHSLLGGEFCLRAFASPRRLRATTTRQTLTSTQTTCMASMATLAQTTFRVITRPLECPAGEGTISSRTFCPQAAVRTTSMISPPCMRQAPCGEPYPPPPPPPPPFLFLLRSCPRAFFFPSFSYLSKHRAFELLCYGKTCAPEHSGKSGISNSCLSCLHTLRGTGVLPI